MVTLGRSRRRRRHPTGHRHRRRDHRGGPTYGYYASHPRLFWGLRPYLTCTPTDLPIMSALTHAKNGKPEMVKAMPDHKAHPPEATPGLPLITDKSFASQRIEHDLTEGGITLLRPNRKNDKTRPGQTLPKTVRQLIDTLNDTLKGQLDLKLHGGRTFAGITVRVTQHLLAMTAAI